MTYSEKVRFLSCYLQPTLTQYTFMQYVGFWLAYTLPTVVFLLCPLVLFFGRNRYIRTPPTGSVFGTAFRLWRFAAKGRCVSDVSLFIVIPTQLTFARWSWNPVRTWRQLTADNFWENAKPSHVVARLGEEGKPKWMRFDDHWVDEVRRGLKACAVFVWIPLWCMSLFLVLSELRSRSLMIWYSNRAYIQPN
jgi:proton-dependent oligopeptide transporter, POT family